MSLTIPSPGQIARLWLAAEAVTAKNANAETRAAAWAAVRDSALLARYMGTAANAERRRRIASREVPA